MRDKLLELQKRSTLIQETLPNRIKSLCLKGLSKKEILADSEVESLRKSYNFLPKNIEEIYYNFTWIWGVQSKFNINYFITKLEKTDAKSWCVGEIESKDGRKNVLGQLGLKNGEHASSNDEVFSFVNITKAKTMSICYVNDGIFFSDLGSNPKERVINFLRRLKIELMNKVELNKEFPESDPHWTSLRSSLNN